MDIMESEIKALRNDVQQLIIDMAILKNTLLDEGELSDWAKQALAEARAEPEENYTSLDDLEKELKNGV